MKTSTKLLIVFFIAIPISLVAYNWSMKQAFLNGNFTVVNWTPTDTSSHALPPFKHVVVDGIIRHKRGWINLRNDLKLQITATDSKNSNEPYQLQVSAHLNGVVQTKVEHDTLFVSLYKETIPEDPYILQKMLWKSTIIIKTSQLNTAKLTHATFILGNFLLKKLSLTVSDGEVHMQNCTIGHTNLMLSEKCSANIEVANSLDTVLYTPASGTHLWIYNGNIKNLETNTPSPENAYISINGKIDDIVNFLEAYNSKTHNKNPL